MNPFFTVVTAGWRPEGVKRVIDFVNKQTYTSWHHIIVNDNNPELRNVLPSLCDGNKRFYIDFGVRTHYYGAFARNAAANVAFSYFSEGLKSKYGELFVCFLDDDNEWLPNHLERIVEAYNERPDASFIGFDIEMRGVKDKNYSHNMNCVVAPQNCDLGSFAYRRDLFDKYGYFQASPRYKITYDWQLIKKIAEGEGDKVYIKHYRPCTFIFNHKER
jgi:glycosyltransferase involved in cell wall biosynthesis